MDHGYMTCKWGESSRVVQQFLSLIRRGGRHDASIVMWVPWGGGGSVMPVDSFGFPVLMLLQGARVSERTF